MGERVGLNRPPVAVLPQRPAQARSAPACRSKRRRVVVVPMSASPPEAGQEGPAAPRGCALTDAMSQIGFLIQRPQCAQDFVHPDRRSRRPVVGVQARSRPCGRRRPTRPGRHVSRLASSRGLEPRRPGVRGGRSSLPRQDSFLFSRYECSSPISAIEASRSNREARERP